MTDSDSMAVRCVGEVGRGKRDF